MYEREDRKLLQQIDKKVDTLKDRLEVRELLIKVLAKLDEIAKELGTNAEIDELAGELRKTVDGIQSDVDSQNKS